MVSPASGIRVRSPAKNGPWARTLNAVVGKSIELFFGGEKGSCSGRQAEGGGDAEVGEKSKEEVTCGSSSPTSRATLPMALAAFSVSVKGGGCGCGAAAGAAGWSNAPFERLALEPGGMGCAAFLGTRWLGCACGRSRCDCSASRAANSCASRRAAVSALYTSDSPTNTLLPANPTAAPLISHHREISNPFAWPPDLGPLAEEGLKFYTLPNVYLASLQTP
jgi:hypothetical protein